MRDTGDRNQVNAINILFVVYSMALNNTYGSMILKMKELYPAHIIEIDSHLKWAKTVLKKSDRIIWYMRLVNAFLSGTSSFDSVLGTYKFVNFTELQHRLEQFYLQNIFYVNECQYKWQKVDELITELDLAEYNWVEKQYPERPVEVQQGDRVIIDYGEKTSWWLLNRGSCSEEARSGRHCGNTAHPKTGQQLISFRTDGRVKMTCVMSATKELQELKSKGNKKPPLRFHPYVMDLLLSDYISSMGDPLGEYDLNFTIFDLSDENLKTIISKKNNLVLTQLSVIPLSLLQAPKWIRTDSAYRSYAVSKEPALEYIAGSNGDLYLTHARWEAAVSVNPKLIIHAPVDIRNFHSRVVAEVLKDNLLFVKAPEYVRYNFKIIESILKLKPKMLEHVHPHADNYDQLCALALSLDKSVIKFIPDKFMKQSFIDFVNTPK